MNKSAQPDVSPSELKDIIELFHEKDGLDLIKDKYGEAVLKSDEVKTAIKMARFNKYWQREPNQLLEEFKIWRRCQIPTTTTLTEKR